MQLRTSGHATRCLTATLCLCVISGCVAAGPSGQTDPSIGEQRSAVVYGADSRQDHYQVTDSSLAALAQRSIVSLMKRENLDESNPSDIRPRGNTFGDAYYLCEDEPFRDQLTASTCSGTLIDEDLVLTAGHCIAADVLNCETMRIVFNYRMVSSRGLAPLTRDDVYRCREVVTRLEDRNERNYFDHAIIRLDRPVSSAHRPAPVSRSETGPNRGDALTMIGFGAGLPMKIDEGGTVTDASYGPGTGVFFGTVDAFGGNSGSGVFNRSGELVGVLSGGNQDFVDTGRGCYATNRLSEGSADSGRDIPAEAIVYPNRALTDACAGSAAGSSLCNPVTPPEDEPTPMPSPAPEAWTCPPDSYGSGDGCDCGCGVFDPDCLTSTDVHGCGPGQICSPTGECTDAPCINPDPDDPANCLDSQPDFRPSPGGPTPTGGLTGTCSVAAGNAGPVAPAICLLIPLASLIRRRRGRSARRPH